MRSWTKASGLFFLAAASVYSGQVIGATPAKPAKSPTGTDSKNTEVKLLEDQADPFAAAPTTKPADASATTATNSSTSTAGTTTTAATVATATSYATAATVTP